MEKEKNLPSRENHHNEHPQSIVYRAVVGDFYKEIDR